MVGSQLRFVASAYTTAQSMIRFADQKAEMLFVIFGILMALLSGRVDVVVRALRDPARVSPLAVATFLLSCVFLGLMFAALSFAVATMHPRFAPREGPYSGGRRRLYWCHDVLGRDREAYLAAVRGLRDDEVLEEMAHELYDVQAIERAKFGEVTKAARISAWGVAVWALSFVLSFTV
ncbi:MAG TPA: hypothetical protein VED18_05430 [Candidatus Sulfotelmatobacter sp.]|nr:hypothetical protein [Candidatus Sulfotelmatobacter sp.]